MRAVALATATSLALVVTYLVLGGASYAPAKVADPCAPRDWREPEGFQKVTEQVVLSTIDGVACELGTSREDVVLAFAGRGSLDDFARDHGLGGEELVELARSGVLRAVDDAEQAGALGASTAEDLRRLARRVSISELLDLLRLLRF